MDQKATENFISNYQPPLKLKFPMALLREWVSLINNDTEWDTPKELSFLEMFVNPAGRVCNEMLLTSGLIICFFSPKPTGAWRKYESLLLNSKRAKRINSVGFPATSWFWIAIVLIREKLLEYGQRIVIVL